MLHLLTFTARSDQCRGLSSRSRRTGLSAKNRFLFFPDKRQHSPAEELHLLVVGPSHKGKLRDPKLPVLDDRGCDFFGGANQGHRRRAEIRNSSAPQTRSQPSVAVLACELVRRLERD